MSVVRRIQLLHYFVIVCWCHSKNHSISWIWKEIHFLFSSLNIEITKGMDPRINKTLGANRESIFYYYQMNIWQKYLCSSWQIQYARKQFCSDRPNIRFASWGTMMSFRWRAESNLYFGYRKFSAVQAISCEILQVNSFLIFFLFVSKSEYLVIIQMLLFKSIPIINVNRILLQTRKMMTW